jgi:hypothetical protein
MMNLPRLTVLGLCLLALAACDSEGSGGSATGTGGKAGAGGASNLGGNAGSGVGGSASGGTSGAAGVGGAPAGGGSAAGGSGSGGKAGGGANTGGSAGSGGRTGSGGAASGGNAGAGSGGSAGARSGGSTGTGGTAGVSAGTGGKAGTGGAATGGAAGSGAGGSTAPAGPCDPYVWPAYDQKINYDYKNEFPDIDPSKFKLLQGCNANVVAGQKSSGWWSFTWGKNRNSKITDAQIDQVLAGLNEDLGYARDVMGWPPDKGPQNGYFSSVYLYGSGLCTDSASNTEEGGWQSAVAGYPMVLISWAPIVNYDRGGITHEAIHAVLASMPGGDKAAWFNEGGNTWLQMNMEAGRTKKYGVGFLDAGHFIAPHMPIECYSGWLDDGSFGGPDAQGVNMSNASNQQISTWRNYLGGVQYSADFAHFIALWVAKGSNAWIWKQKGRNILETLATGIGAEQTRHLVTEYRARQALIDFKEWTDAFKSVVNSNWGINVTAENNTPGGIWKTPPAYTASAYAKSTTTGKTVTPEPLTLPGWTGANQIPITVSGDQLTVKFNPVDANMTLQLAYRASDGSAVYSQPVASGEACLRMDKAPKNSTVIAVVTSTDYIYTGDAIRSKKYSYTLELGTGATATASTTGKYF